MRFGTKLFLLLCAIPSIALAVVLQVEIKGVTSELAKSIRADLHLEQAIKEEKLTANRIKNLYQLAPEQITATLQAKGYYNSKITADLQDIPGSTPEQDKWVATFVIEQGKATTIQSVNISIEGPGQNNPKLKALRATPKLIIGQVLIHEN